MIRMIMGRTMMGGVRDESVHVHSFHSIREIIVPDSGSLRDGISMLRVVRGEVRVKDVEKEL